MQNLYQWFKVQNKEFKGIICMGSIFLIKSFAMGPSKTDAELVKARSNSLREDAKNHRQRAVAVFLLKMQ